MIKFLRSYFKIRIVFAGLFYCLTFASGCIGKNGNNADCVVSIWVEYFGVADFPTQPIVLTNKKIGSEEFRKEFESTNGYRNAKRLFGADKAYAIIDQFVVSDEELSDVYFSIAGKKTKYSSLEKERMNFGDGEVGGGKSVGGFYFLITSPNFGKGHEERRLDLKSAKEVFAVIELVSRGKYKDLHENITSLAKRVF